MLTQPEWDTEAATLRDDGYGQREIDRALGPRPGLNPSEVDYMRARTEFAATTLRGLTSPDVLLATERKRVAPATDGPTLSWEGKRERLARKMAVMRKLHWDSLSYEARDGLLALAEFVLEAMALVEEDVQRVKARPLV